MDCHLSAMNLKKEISHHSKGDVAITIPVVSEHILDNVWDFNLGFVEEVSQQIDDFILLELLVIVLVKSSHKRDNVGSDSLSEFKVGESVF